MPYAIYRLTVDGAFHHDFASYSKDTSKVIGDVAHYLNGQYYERATRKPDPLNQQSLAADMFLDRERIAHQLESADLEVLEVINETDEKVIDVALSSLEKFGQLKHTTQYLPQEAQVVVSRLEFGLRKLVSQRFSPFRHEHPDSHEGTDTQLRHHVYQASMFLGILSTTVDMTEYDKLIKMGIDKGWPV